MKSHEHLNAHEQAAPRVIKSGLVLDGALAVGMFHAVLMRGEEVVWEDEFSNLVLNGGKADLLDKYFAGAGYTAAWYMGLVDGDSAPTYNAADTMASHAGWTEATAYAAANRPTIAWNAASATGGGAGSAGTGSKASTAVAFSINATDTIAGCFLASNNTKGGTSGIAYSAGSFSGGNRAVQSGDTLSITWTGAV